MTADKHIPVTEERRRQLDELKAAGQSYDELLADMIDSYRGDRWLAAQAQDARTAPMSEYTPLDDID